jgi:hypothetical protein
VQPPRHFRPLPHVGDGPQRLRLGLDRDDFPDSLVGNEFAALRTGRRGRGARVSPARGRGEGPAVEATQLAHDALKKRDEGRP